MSNYIICIEWLSKHGEVSRRICMNLRDVTITDMAGLREAVREQMKRDGFQFEDDSPDEAYYVVNLTRVDATHPSNTDKESE